MNSIVELNQKEIGAISGGNKCEQVFLIVVITLIAVEIEFFTGTIRRNISRGAENLRDWWHSLWRKPK
jgi:hypothetical protein